MSSFGAWLAEGPNPQQHLGSSCQVSATPTPDKAGDVHNLQKCGNLALRLICPTQPQEPLIRHVHARVVRCGTQPHQRQQCKGA